MRLFRDSEGRGNYPGRVQPGRTRGPARVDGTGPAGEGRRVMSEKGDYIVMYKFVSVTWEEVEHVMEEISSEMGIIPVKVEKIEKNSIFVQKSCNEHEHGE